MRRSCPFALALASCLVAPVARAEPAGSAAVDPVAGAVVDDVDALPRVVDEGVLLEALGTLLASAQEPARVAVVVVDDIDEPRRRSLERAIVRVLRDRRREDIVTPSLIRAALTDRARSELEGAASSAAAGMAADHIVIGAVGSAADGAVLALKLLSTERGQVLASARVVLEGTTAGGSTARARSVGVACADLADAIAAAVEARGVAARNHRIGVPPLVATGAAREARLDRFLQNELSDALRARGFLVVERGELTRAMDQLSLQELTGTEKVAELGQLLGAQSLVLGTVAEDGNRFVVNARVVDVEGAGVLGAAKASIEREGVVTMAAVETRTPVEAALRSAVAPGWGQAYNGEGMKAGLIGVSTYTALAGTLVLGGTGIASWTAYQNVRPGQDGLTAETAAKTAAGLREQANVLFTTTAVVGGLTAALWSLGIADALVSCPDVD